MSSQYPVGTCVTASPSPREWLAACAHLSQRPLIQVLLQGLNESRLWDGTNDCVHLLAILEDHDGGNAPDAILCGHAWALICVELVLHINTQMVGSHR